MGGGISESTSVVGSSFSRDLPHSLLVLEPGSSDGTSAVGLSGRNDISCDKLLADAGSHYDSNQDSSTQSTVHPAVVYEITSSREPASQRFFCWAGTHSLEIYLIHGFTLCLLKLVETPVLHSAIGWPLVAVNFTITVAFSCLFITIISKNKLLNKILYWK